MESPYPRPGGITALCVLTIVLGALGLLTSLVAVGGLLLPGQMQSEHEVRNWMLIVIRLNVATALLFGGGWSLRLKPIGRMTLLAAFGLGILFEVFQLWPAWEARDVSGPALPGFDGTMKTLGQAIATTQLAVAVAALLTRSGIYGFGLWYLTRPRVANLFPRPEPAVTKWA